MVTFEEFLEILGTALARLYDPAYQPPDALLVALGCPPGSGSAAAQAAIIAAIERLAPGPDVPNTARSRRIYDVLSLRYVQRLTQEDTAHRLSITPRHLRREQRLGLEVLAKQIWQDSQTGTPHKVGGEVVGGEGSARSEDPGEGTEADAWRSQVRQELDLLRETAQHGVADVGETIAGALELVRPLTSKRNVEVKPGAVAPGLAAAVLPSSLRQIMVGTILELVRHMAAGQVEVSAREEAQRIVVTLVASPTAVDGSPRDLIVRELAAMQGVTIDLQATGDTVSYDLGLPPAHRVSVLVVDDNPDLVHFYKRYVRGTRYQLTSVEGKRILEAATTMAPDAIVLDVMLPDADGWELLANLHQHPATRSIPVIVCSVVREEELALALGATLYIAKPVGRQQFISALDRALGEPPSQTAG